MIDKFWYTYVLRSLKDGKLYIGSTGNLLVRIQQHNAGGVKATKNRIPIKLVYFEGCASKKQAERRERYFKTGFGRRFLKARIFGK